MQSTLIKLIGLHRIHQLKDVKPGMVNHAFTLSTASQRQASLRFLPVCLYRELQPGLHNETFPKKVRYEGRRESGLKEEGDKVGNGG